MRIEQNGGIMQQEYNEQLKCGLTKYAYDFPTQYGELYFPEGDCCDMTGAIEFFKKIDKDVSLIVTFSGEKADTSYRKGRDSWYAFN